MTERDRIRMRILEIFVSYNPLYIDITFDLWKKAIGGDYLFRSGGHTIGDGDYFNTFFNRVYLTANGREKEIYLLKKDCKHTITIKYDEVD